MRLVAALVALAVAAEARASEPPVLVLIARAPIDAGALAGVLRTYLEGYSIEVEPAGDEGAPPALREQLSDARERGDSRRAVAVVRLVEGEGRIEVQLIDRLGEK